MRRLLIALAVSALPFAHAVHVAAQGNVLLPVPVIERLLRGADFTVNAAQGARGEGDRTQFLALSFPGDTLINAQFAPAPIGGGAYNNEPRYEVAAYQLQKLFLSEPEYVVPVTVVRAFPVATAMQYDDRVQATFDEANSTVVVLQYWLNFVSPDDFWDEDRFEADTVYARNLANMNVLTHLINHLDANEGNFLISTTPDPRVFAVDNGVAFRSDPSNRGSEWRNLRIDRLPHATVERLRGITASDLTRTLGVLAQFEARDGLLYRVEPSANLDDSRGVRVDGSIIQFGLTGGEIGDIRGRLERLLRSIDDGRITVF